MHLGIEILDEKKPKQNKTNPKKRKPLGVLDPLDSPPKKNQNTALGRTRTQRDESTTSGLLSFVVRILETPFSHRRVITGLAFSAFFSAPSDIRR